MKFECKKGYQTPGFWWNLGNPLLQTIVARDVVYDRAERNSKHTHQFHTRHDSSLRRYWYSFCLQGGLQTPVVPWSGRLSQGISYRVLGLFGHPVRRPRCVVTVWDLGVAFHLQWATRGYMLCGAVAKLVWRCKYRVYRISWLNYCIRPPLSLRHNYYNRPTNNAPGVFRNRWEFPKTV